MISFLFGQDPTDDSPTPPLPADISTPNKDLYNNGTSWPSIDGEDMMPKLLAENTARTAQGAGLEALHGLPNNTAAVTADRKIWLSTEVLVEGRFKLLVSRLSMQ
jgi:hypothetical protein